MKAELQEFLTQFLASAGAPDHGVYLRVDAFFDELCLKIIEINACFVDGWGIALNLTRAANHPVYLSHVRFPTLWVVEEKLYRPEAELACDELRLHDQQARVIRPGELKQMKKQPLVYWYGRSRDYPNIVPAGGPSLDNKLHLARFSRGWQGDLVHTPHCHWNEATPWDELPPDGVVKPCDKDRANSVQVSNISSHRLPVHLRQLYEAGKIVVQERIEPYLTPHGSPTQLIIMTAGARPIAGYLQIARPGTFCITDNSTHGPLLFGD